MQKPVLAQNISVFDDPQSRVRYLETLLHGQDWRANIVIPPGSVPDPAAHAAQLEQELQHKGMYTSITHDPDGFVTLHLHQFGSNSDLHATFEELGLVQGTAHNLGNIGTGLSNGLRSSIDFVDYVVKEPGRLFSGLYLLGDGAMIAQGWFNKPAGEASKVKKPLLQSLGDGIKQMRAPENFLGTASGIFATLQSLIVLKYNNSGAEMNVADLKEKFQRGQRAGMEDTNVKAWTNKALDNSPFYSMDRSLRRHPMEAGAWMMIGSQLAMISAAGIEMSHHMKEMKGAPKVTQSALTLIRTKDSLLQPHELAQKKNIGSGLNIFRSLMSLTGWTIMLQPRQHFDQKAEWGADPVKRFQQELSENPEKYTAGIIGSASAIGMVASVMKKNYAQLWGEALWLSGDLILLAVNKSHYGAEGGKQEKPLVDATTEFITTLPAVLGEAAQTRMVNDLAEYLAGKTVRDQADGKGKSPEEINKEIAELKQNIATGVNANLKEHKGSFHKLIHATARLIEKYPPAHHAAMIEHMAKALSTAPGIHVTQKEFIEAVSAAVQVQNPEITVPPRISHVAPDIAHILLVSPVTSNAAIAMAMYDASAAISGADKRGPEILQHAIQQEAEKTLGISKHQLREATHATHAEMHGGTPVLA